MEYTAAEKKTGEYKALVEERWKALPSTVKAAALDMAYNSGSGGFRNYKKFIRAVNAGDFKRAANEMVDSKDGGTPEKVNKSGKEKRRYDYAKEIRDGMTSNPKFKQSADEMERQNRKITLSPPGTKK